MAVPQAATDVDQPTTTVTRVRHAFCEQVPFTSDWNDDSKLLTLQALAASMAVYADDAHGVLAKLQQCNSDLNTGFLLGEGQVEFIPAACVSGSGGDRQQQLRVETESTIIVAFRGSTNRHDWRRNFAVTQSVQRGLNGCYVHEGFQRRAASVQICDLLHVLTEQGCSKQLTFTGHSLGGAVATLCTLLAKERLAGTTHVNARVDCITFGAPAVADMHAIHFAQVRDWQYDFINIVNGHDCVPGALNMRSTMKAIRREMSAWQRTIGADQGLWANVLRATTTAITTTGILVQGSSTVALGIQQYNAALNAFKLLRRVCNQLVEELDHFVPFTPHVFLPSEEEHTFSVEVIRSPVTVKSLLCQRSSMRVSHLAQHLLANYSSAVRRYVQTPGGDPSPFCEVQQPPLPPSCFGDLVARRGRRGRVLRIRIRLQDHLRNVRKLDDREDLCSVTIYRPDTNRPIECKRPVELGERITAIFGHNDTTQQLTCRIRGQRRLLRDMTVRVELSRPESPETQFHVSDPLPVLDATANAETFFTAFASAITTDDLEDDDAQDVDSRGNAGGKDSDDADADGLDEDPDSEPESAEFPEHEVDDNDAAGDGGEGGTAGEGRLAPDGGPGDETQRG